jgi:small neutral amino acid transporter SnatA (MarC family)
MGALIGGIIAVVLGLAGLVKWFPLFLKALAAAVPFLLLVGGVIAIAAGISDLKDKMEEQKEKKEEKKEEKPAQ